MGDLRERSTQQKTAADADKEDFPEPHGTSTAPIISSDSAPDRQGWLPSIPLRKEGPGPFALGCDLCQATAVLVAIFSGSNSSPRSSDRGDHFLSTSNSLLVSREREDVGNPWKRWFWLLSYRFRQAFRGFVVRSTRAHGSNRQESLIDSRGPGTPIPHRNRHNLVATRCDYL